MKEKGGEKSNRQKSHDFKKQKNRWLGREKKTFGEMLRKKPDLMWAATVQAIYDTLVYP
jgi:hypothetical protein